MLIYIYACSQFFVTYFTIRMIGLELGFSSIVETPYILWPLLTASLLNSKSENKAFIVMATLSTVSLLGIYWPVQQEQSVPANSSSPVSSTDQFLNILLASINIWTQFPVNSCNFLRIEKYFSSSCWCENLVKQPIVKHLPRPVSFIVSDLQL